MLSETTCIRFVSTAKNLGITMDNTLTFQQQVLKLKKKSFLTLRKIRKIRNLLTEDQLKVVTNSVVVSCLDYCNVIYFGINKRDLNHLQVIQNNAAKCVTGKFKCDHMENDLLELHWLNIQRRIVFKIALLVFKALIGLAPVYLQDLLSYKDLSTSRRPCDLYVPIASTKYGIRAFSTVGPKVWNQLPSNIKECSEVTIFKKKLKTHLFNLDESDVRKLGLFTV